MNTMKGFDAAQSRYDAMVPDDFDDIEPSSDHYDEAFTRLVNDDDMLQEFMDDMPPDTTTIFQLFHAADNNLPLNDGTQDDIAERMTETCNAFLSSYRTWLEHGHKLADMADTVMREEVEASRIEAEEYAADCRADARMGL